MKYAIAMGALVAAVFPHFSSAESAPVLTNIGNFVAGESCRTPIFHTDFAFPPEGGQIVQNGNQMYFIKTYLPGCGNASAFGTPISTSSTNTFSQTQVATAVQSPAPVYTAPVTGCKN